MLVDGFGVGDYPLLSAPRLSVDGRSLVVVCGVTWVIFRFGLDFSSVVIDRYSTREVKMMEWRTS